MADADVVDALYAIASMLFCPIQRQFPAPIDGYPLQVFLLRLSNLEDASALAG